MEFRRVLFRSLLESRAGCWCANAWISRFGGTTLHTRESLARDYNNEVVVPPIWQPPRFDRNDWLWMKSVAQSGPAQDSKITNILVGSGQSARRLTCMHRTQPRRNFTVFYRRLAEDMIVVIGVGSHNASNQHRSEEHTSELQSHMHISNAVFCLKNK